ncbi:class D beta-lactamase [Advenella sp. FME57]|nr:class D beta-lactamase [Advenella sp. FME57]
MTLPTSHSRIFSMKHSPIFRAISTSVVVLVLACTSAYANTHCIDSPKVTAVFEKAAVQGTIALLNTKTGEVICHNSARANRPYLPASTYKIPNTLIALETGVASGADFSLDWNQKRNPRQAWWPAVWAKDQTLNSALSNSVVWYYQELARRINPQRMQQYVDQFRYGNRDISGAIDQFWLKGKLKISALEQISFLQHFYFQQLGVARRNTNIVKQAIVLEKTPSWTLSGKTGMVGFGDAKDVALGWLVGYVETANNTYIYAMNMDITKTVGAQLRLEVTKSVLKELGLI